MDKVFGTKSTFHVKKGTTRKFQFLFFMGCFASIEKLSFWQEDWALKKQTLWPLFMDGVLTASRLQPFWGSNLLFATKFPEVPGTHFIDLWRMGELSRPWKGEWAIILWSSEILVIFQVVRQLVYTMLITNNHASHGKFGQTPKSLKTLWTWL